MKRSLSSLKKKTDALYSRYRRMSVADDNGNVVCVTCGKRDHYKSMHLGHFVSRNYLATRWHEKNTDIQCVGCNLYGGGKPDEFAYYLIQKYGEGIISELHNMKRKTVKLSLLDYEAKIEDLKRKIKELGEK